MVETETRLSGWLLCGIWCGAVGSTVVPDAVYSGTRCRRFGTYRHCVAAVLIFREAYIMQIVVVKSPKFFGGILRRFFRIKKGEDIG